jgi:hypothetical protein
MSMHGSLYPDPLVRDELHLCQECRRPFVVPLSILPLMAQDGYVVELRCSNCDHASIAVHDDDQLERLDRELDRQTGRLRHALAELELADQLERVDRFVAALAADAILPEDF